MWYCILPSIVLIGVCVLLNYVIFRVRNSTKFDVYLCSFLTTTTVIFLIALWILELAPTPSALDVYRDNTELEITSVNGVPIDTVVVFKNK